jgi:DNA-binding NarL/FixJ family response regulator
MESNRHALIVAPSSAVAAAVFRRFGKLLTEGGCEVHRAPPGNDALTLLQSTGFDLILVGFPLADPPIRDLLRSVRWRESACRTASLVLITLESMAEAQELLQRGVNRVVRIDAPEEELRQVVSDLLAVAPRVALRTTLRLAVRRERGVERAVAQTDNVSLSGMLVRGSQSYARGTIVQFEFLLPGQPGPVAGEGEVIRGTTRERESVRGYAVRFVSFAGEGRQRLEQYLEGRSGEA